MNSGWWWVYYVRAALEMAYFVAGILIAIFAYRGLKQLTIAAEQLKLTKKIATTDERRESVKFAAERCQYYAEKCVDVYTKLQNEHQRLTLTFLTTYVPFTISGGEIRPQGFNEYALAQEFAKTSGFIVGCLNTLEAFAIPFVTEVADDEVGFQETAPAFCKMTEELIGCVILLRRQGMRYESIVKLYDRWKSRLVAQNLEGKMKQMQEQHKAVAEKGKVKSNQPY